MIEIKRYSSDDVDAWDSIVEKSRNGTFLHRRSYMDYHAERFLDFSVLIFRLDKLVAVFPASLSGNTICSHGGLTFGGIISLEDFCASEALEALEEIRKLYVSHDILKVLVKAIPYIYHKYPCQEDLYALYRSGAKLFRRDISSAIYLRGKVKYSKGRKWSINKACKSGVTIRETLDPAKFHSLLVNTLKPFNATPTHSLQELVLLMNRFPGNIKVFEAYLGEELLSGTVLYDFGTVAHTQYMASSSLGREVGALDFLIATLIEKNYAERDYFSFGISTEQQGNFLNSGLIAQKEGFGARAVVHDFYEWIL